MENKLKNRKGFTLAELLIVVAIIGVLVAISIPVFTTQLEKAREATDMANIRAAYAEVMAEALTDPDHNHKAEVKLKQTQTNWQSSGDVAGINVTLIKQGEGTLDAVAKGGSVFVKYTAGSDGTGTVNIGGQTPTATFVTSGA